MTTTVCTILFAHGSRDPRWREPFDAVLAQAKKQAGAQGRVELAFLELMSPSLGDVLDGLIAEGQRHIRIAPLFFAAGQHLRVDLPELVAEAQARHPGLQVEILPPMGASALMQERIADWAISQSAP